MANRSCTGAVPVLPLVGGRGFSCRFLGAVVALLAACGGERAAAAYDSPGVYDDAGRLVPLAPEPRRIISLLPAATELIVALGAGDHLVARTSWDAQPELAHLASFGRTLTPSIEAIYALGPDLVIVPPDILAPGLADRLAAAGLRVYQADAQRLDAVLATTTRLGRLLGEAARADALRRSIGDGLAALRADRAGARNPRVVYAVWHAPPQVAGADTYVHDILSAAGARNVFGDLRGWPEVSAEALVARDPDVIIVPRGEDHSLQPEWLPRTPGWSALRAVREGHLVVVDSDLFNRPGPRVLEAARTLAAALDEVRAP